MGKYETPPKANILRLSRRELIYSKRGFRLDYAFRQQMRRWFHACHGRLMRCAIRGVLDMHRKTSTQSTRRWARQTLYSYARTHEAHWEDATPLIGCLFSQCILAAQWPHSVYLKDDGKGRKFLQLDWSNWDKSGQHPMLAPTRLNSDNDCS